MAVNEESIMNVRWQEIYLCGKYIGWARIEDVLAYFNGEITDLELIHRCVKELPRGNVRLGNWNNAQNN